MRLKSTAQCSLPIRIQNIVQHWCIQDIVQSMNKGLEKPHRIRLFEAPRMFLVETLKEFYCTMS